LKTFEEFIDILKKDNEAILKKFLHRLLAFANYINQVRNGSSDAFAIKLHP
jgi:hypothetical protein